MQTKISPAAELRDAYEGQGNAHRYSFQQWVENMANDPRGTLQASAREYLNKQETCEHDFDPRESPDAPIPCCGKCGSPPRIRGI